MKLQSSLDNVNDVRCVSVSQCQNDIVSDVKKFRIDVKTVKSSDLTLNDELHRQNKLLQKLTVYIET